MRTPSGFPNAPATASDALFRKPSLICAFGTDVAITQVGIVAKCFVVFFSRSRRGQLHRKVKVICVAYNVDKIEAGSFLPSVVSA